MVLSKGRLRDPHRLVEVRVAFSAQPPLEVPQGAIHEPGGRTEHEGVSLGRPRADCLVPGPRVHLQAKR